MQELQDRVAKWEYISTEMIKIRKEIVDFHRGMVLLENYSALSVPFSLWTGPLWIDKFSWHSCQGRLISAFCLRHSQKKSSSNHFPIWFSHSPFLKESRDKIDVTDGSTCPVVILCTILLVVLPQIFWAAFFPDYFRRIFSQMVIDLLC